MENNETPDPLYKQGFNEGYVIAKHLPAFNAKPFKGLEKSARGLGFQHGQKQFIIEKNQDRLPGYLKKDHTQKGKAARDKNKDNKDRD